MKQLTIATLLSAAATAASSLGNVQQLLGGKQPTTLTSSGQGTQTQVTSINVGGQKIDQANNKVQLTSTNNNQSISGGASLNGAKEITITTTSTSSSSSGS